jgi:hypothetical protein
MIRLAPIDPAGLVGLRTLLLKSAAGECLNARVDPDLIWKRALASTETQLPVAYDSTQLREKAAKNR